MNMLKINEVYWLDCMAGFGYVDDASVDLVISDPPYEVSYNEKSKWLSKFNGGYESQILRDSSFVDVVPSYDIISSELFRVLKPDSHCYLFCGDRQIGLWSDAMHRAGFKRPQVLVWRKENTTFDMTFGHKFPENKEFILFFHKGWKKLNGYGVERSRFRSCLDFCASKDTGWHSCAKPMDLLYFLVKLSSRVGDVCFDPFAGSGNHLLAFKRLGRNFLGFELSKPYYRNIVRRLRDDAAQSSLSSFWEY